MDKQLVSLLYGLYALATENTLEAIGKREEFAKLALSNKDWIAQRRADVDKIIKQLTEKIQKGTK